MLSGAAATAAAAALVAAPPAPRASAAASFVKGADLSWVPQMEAAGYYWNDASGARADILTIMKTYGITAVRLRTWVDPSDDPAAGHCSADETARFAKRCQDAGLQLMIDPHFGDTWNSVGTQKPPAAWASMSYPQMLKAMNDYVFHLMNVLKYYKVTPTWVQLGNETNSGICLPVGSVSQNPSQLAGLLNAAHDNVKNVFPSASTIIHLAQPQNGASITSWLDTYQAQGGKWDISGFSSYASGTATIDGIISNYQTVQARYGKPVMQVEFGGRVDRASRTESDLRYFIQRGEEVGTLGLFYWEPEGYSPFTDYQMVAWDGNTRKPTTALNGFSA